MKNMPYVILLLIFVSCTIVRTVNVADYHKEMIKNIQTAEKNVQKVDQDLQEHNQISVKWSDAQSNNRGMKLTQIQQNIKQYYYRLKEDFGSSKFADKKKITSKDPQYAEFQKFSDEMNQRLDALNAQFSNYKKESDALNAYLATKKIYRVDKPRMNQDFLTALNESKKTQKKLKYDLIEFSQKATKDDKPKIQELVKIVEKMENETFKLQRLYSASMKEVSTGVKFVTPGMKSHDYRGKIESYVKEIQLQSDTFSKKAAEFGF